MTGKEHLSSKPQDRPYEEFPLDNAIRNNLVVHRNTYDADGRLIPGATRTEAGWIAAGSSVINGVEYTRVRKVTGEDVPEGQYLEKDVSTDQLNRWQEMAREEREARQAAVAPKMATDAVASALVSESRAPAWADLAGGEHDSFHDALTPAQFKALQAQFERQNAAPAAQEAARVESRAEMIDRLLSEFSDADKLALQDFADAAVQKRDAQRHGEGDISMECSRDMGASLRAMSSSAQSQARRIASAIHGSSNVAF